MEIRLTWSLVIFWTRMKASNLLAEGHFNKMTKQSQVSADAPTVDFLRRRFKMADEYIASIRKDNENAGVKGDYVQWRGHESMEKKRVEDFIAKATDRKRPGRWWQFSDLKNKGYIPEDEESEYEKRTYPFRQVNSIIKRKLPDGRFVLQRFETWYALDANGQEIHRSFDFLDYYAKPRIEYDRLPADPQNPDGPSVRVKIVNHPDNHENNLVREYITPWSSEKFQEILDYSVNNDNSTTGPSFVLVHPSYSNPVTATKEQMLAPNEEFDSVFKEIFEPKGDFKDFLKDIKKQAKKAADDADQYR